MSHFTAAEREKLEVELHRGNYRIAPTLRGRQKDLIGILERGEAYAVGGGSAPVLIVPYITGGWPPGASLPLRIAESTGTAYYVGGSGASDSNAGTNPAAPWATIGKVYASMPANGIAYVRDGTYIENNTCTVAGTSSTVRTIVAENGRGRVVIRGKLIVDTGASFWRHRDLRFYNAQQTAGVGIKVTGSAVDCEFDGIQSDHANLVGDSDSSNPQGFMMSGTSTRIHYYYCIANQNGRNPESTSDHGFYFQNGIACVAANCIAYANAAHGFHISNSGTTTSFRDGWIVNCLGYLQRMRSGIIIIADNAAITPANAPGNNQVRNCIMALNASNGYQFGSSGTTVAPDVPNISDSNISYRNGTGDEFENPANYVTTTNFITDVNPQLIDPVRGMFAAAIGGIASGFGVEAYMPPKDYWRLDRTQVDAGPVIPEGLLRPKYVDFPRPRMRKAA